MRPMVVNKFPIPTLQDHFDDDYACKRHQKRRQKVFWGFTFVQGGLTF